MFSFFRRRCPTLVVGLNTPTDKPDEAVAVHEIPADTSWTMVRDCPPSVKTDQTSVCLVNATHVPPHQSCGLGEIKIQDGVYFASVSKKIPKGSSLTINKTGDAAWCIEVPK